MKKLLLQCVGAAVWCRLVLRIQRTIVGTYTYSRELSECLSAALKSRSDCVAIRCLVESVLVAAALTRTLVHAVAGPNARALELAVSSLAE